MSYRYGICKSCVIQMCCSIDCIEKHEERLRQDVFHNKNASDEDIRDIAISIYEIYKEDRKRG